MDSSNDMGEYFKKVASTLNEIDGDEVERFVSALLRAFHEGKQVLVFGNGGSSATASHFTGDLVMGVSRGPGERFRAQCLSDNIPALMACANDISYEDIFIERIGQDIGKDDIVLAISGSGNSPNVVKGLKHAKQKGATTVALCGFDGGKIKEIADISVHANIMDMEISEDAHLVILHYVKQQLKKRLSSAADAFADQTD